MLSYPQYSEIEDNLEYGQKCNHIFFFLKGVKHIYTCDQANNSFLTCSGLGRAWILSCKDGVSTVPKQNFKFSVKNQLHQQS